MIEKNTDKAISNLNPWRSKKDFTFDLGIQRKQFLSLLSQFFDFEEVIALIGVRRSGKTTLLFQLIKKLLEKVDSQNVLFLQADNEIIAKLLNNSQLGDIIDHYWMDKTKPFYLFIDEIQDVKNWEIQLKNTVDRKLKIRIFITGSSASKIKSEAIRYLVGRILFFNIFPFNFSEYCQFVGKLDNMNLFDCSMEELFSVDFHQNFFNLQQHEALIQKTLRSYMSEGGFPRIVLMNDLYLKSRTLQDYFDLIIKRDILAYFDNRSIMDLEALSKYLAIRVADKSNYTVLSQKLGLNLKTLKRYVYQLEQSFLFYKSLFFSNNPYKAKKPFKGYCVDNGMSNLLSGYFGVDIDSTRLGFLAENLVAQKLVQKFEKDLHYWQDRYGNEVDFIVEEKRKLYPIEVKFSKNIDKKDLKGLINFCKKHNIKKGIVVDKFEYKKEKIDGVDVVFVPLWVFLLI